eukprot:CAMPEP_0183377294 /NCGR_PEP_ID=MMETSP0164_2-20130417/122674_1 /TAXON_ID=221442 /ORGANISM="Coccolithus pelagicus ssp braarudi, Strain PLY182g" /LENGTH=101 /DNA_ID=CAMNT_0025554735 /DNA_START=166 /DNA_END=467 /DNA_ORIENTATION=+
MPHIKEGRRAVVGQIGESKGRHALTEVVEGVVGLPIARGHKLQQRRAVPDGATLRVLGEPAAVAPPAPALGEDRITWRVPQLRRGYPSQPRTLCWADGHSR